MANEFSLSKLSAALKAVNDAGEALARGALDAKPNADGKVSADIEPLKSALVGVWDCIAPRAQDTDPKGTPADDPTRSVHSVDKKRASDSHVIHSIDAIFSKDGEDTSASGIDSIFTRKRLAEG